MKSASLRIVFALFALAGPAGVRAQSDEPARPPVPAHQHDEIYVYSNADLEALGPLPSQDTPLAEHAMGWNDVQRFIADHHDRLQLERRYQIERALTEEALEDQRPRYGLALAPWGYWGYGKSRAQRIHETRHTDFANRIVPLHARQSLIKPLLRNDRRGRVGSGRDAIPSRRPTPRGGSARGPRFNRFKGGSRR